MEKLLFLNLGVMKRINVNSDKVTICEATLEEDTTFFGSNGVNYLTAIKARSQIVIANLYDDCLDDVQQKFIPETCAAAIEFPT